MTHREETHIRLGIRSVSVSDQCLRCLHEETLGPYGENPRRNKWFLFFSAKFFFFFLRKGCFAAKRKKESFFLGLICTCKSRLARFECEYWWKCQRPHKDTHTCQTEADRVGAIYFARRKFVFCDVAAEISAQVMVRRQIIILYVGSASSWNWPTCRIHTSFESYIWAAALQNKQNDMCAQRRLRPTRASAQSDQCLHRAHNG